jgi:aquaporin Z
MAYAVGHISGGHFNPAVSLGLWAAGKFPAKDLVGYLIVQLIVACIAASALYLILIGKSDFVEIGGLLPMDMEICLQGNSVCYLSLLQSFCLQCFFFANYIRKY